MSLILMGMWSELGRKRLSAKQHGETLITGSNPVVPSKIEMK